MGIFDTNSRHPLETLLDTVRYELNNGVVPRLFNHGNIPTECSIRDLLDIEFERLKIWGKPGYVDEIGKIGRLRVRRVNSQVFRVIVQYISKYGDEGTERNIRTGVYYPVLCEYLIGKNGIIE